jgi:hypothetical protein
MDEINGLFSGELSLPSENYQEMYLAVYEQLQKDFHPYAALQKPTEQLTAQWLYEEVARLTSDLIQSQPASLSAFLYRVDISESQMKRSMSIASPEQKLDQLTWMILKREAQKVWIRRHLK